MYTFYFYTYIYVLFLLLSFKLQDLSASSKNDRRMKKPGNMIHLHIIWLVTIRPPNIVSITIKHAK